VLRNTRADELISGKPAKVSSATRHAMIEFAPAEEPRQADAPDPSDPHIRWMIPRINLRFRIGLCAVLLILLVISPGGWGGKFIGLAMIAFLTGSFRESFIDSDILYVQLTICFIPLKLKKYRLKKYIQIEIELEQPAGWWTFILLGPVYWLWMRIIDFTIPWFGGLFQLWIANKKKRVLVWQGCSEDDFNHNLQQLKTATGLEAIRAGRY
jgi:hypothetical protein